MLNRKVSVGKGSPKNRKLIYKGEVLLEFAIILFGFFLFILLRQMVTCFILKHILRRRSLKKMRFPLTQTSFAVFSFSSYFCIRLHSQMAFGSLQIHLISFLYSM